MTSSICSRLPGHLHSGYLGIAATIVISILSVLEPLANAQSVPSATHAAASFARFVPPSAKLFVTVHRLGDVDAALHRAKVWRLVPLIGGQKRGAERTFDLRETVTRFLGPDSSIRMEDLLKTELALVADSWSSLGNAIWMVRLVDGAVLDRWFPLEKRRETETSSKARFFRTEGGMVVCVRDGIAAMTRRSESPLLAETLRLMIDHKDALRSPQPFDDLTAYLPAKSLAVAFVAFETGAKEAGLPLIPKLDRAVIGLYEGDGRLDLAIRASLDEPHPKVELADHAIERMLRLPQTTILAAATTIDVSTILDAALKNPSSSLAARYLTMFAGFRGGQSTDPPLSTRIGPHLLFAWEDDVREKGVTPQLAIMVESGDPSALASEIKETVELAVRWIQSVDPEAEVTPPKIEQQSHWGTVITHMPFGDFPRKSRLPLASLLSGTDPAWASWGHWFIFALSAEHVERILDAQNGLIPPLASVRDVSSMNLHNENWRTAWTLQAGLAANVLERWLEHGPKAQGSLLDPSAWGRGRSRLADQVNTPKLGIGVRANEEPGVVVVATIHPGGAADGKLQPDDRILGVDGALLDLSSPNADLRKRFAQSTTGPGPVFRVQRGEVLQDVTLERPVAPEPVSYPTVPPSEALRELADLARGLQFASLAVKASDESHYSAFLSLRLATEPPTARRD